MKYFVITVIVDGDKLEKFPICTSTAKAAKKFVEKHWMENQVYNARVVKVGNSSYEEWAKLVWGDQFEN